MHGPGLHEALGRLLAGGASPTGRDNAGETPLLYVKILLTEELYDSAATVAQMLLGSGAPVDDTNNEVGLAFMLHRCCWGRAHRSMIQIMR